MERAVDPVLHQVGEEHDLDELQDKRLIADPGAEAGPVGVLEDRQRWRQRHEGERLHEQAANKEVEHVLAPLVAEDVLFAPAEQPLDGDEDDAAEEQVQQEPIEAEINGCVDGDAVLRSRAAEDGGDEHQRERRKAEDLLLPERDADDAQDERGDEPQVEGEADEADVVKLASLGDGEDFRIAQAEDGAEAGDGEDEGEHAADPAGAEAAVLGGIEFVADSVHVTSCDGWAGRMIAGAASAGMLE